MRIHNLLELRDHIQGKWTPELFTETLQLHKIPFIVKWIHEDNLELGGLEIAAQMNWDPETTLLLYIEPYDKKKDYPNYKEVAGQLSLLNTTQCTCSFIENMTIEKFAKNINQLAGMKAFL